MKNQKTIVINLVKNVIILLMTFAIIFTTPGFTILLSAFDFSKEEVFIEEISDEFESESYLEEIDLTDAVYYSKPERTYEVKKFKDALLRGEVTILIGKRAKAVFEKFSCMLPEFYRQTRTGATTVYSSGSVSENTRIADMTKYLKNDYIPMFTGIGQNENIDVMTGSLSLSFPLAKIVGAGGADISLSLIYNSADSNLSEKSWGESINTSYYVRYGELLITTDDAGNNVSYYGENSIKYFATEQDKYSWMSPYVYPVGTEVEYNGRDAVYYQTAILEEGTFVSPLPVSKPKVYLSDSNGLAPGWKFDIPTLERLDNPTASDDADVYYILHFGDNSYRIKNLAFENRMTTDLSIEAVNIMVCGKTAVFLISEKDGTKYYFDGDGTVICSEDRYGRRISYSFTVIAGKPHLSSITDDFGRSISVSYDASGVISSVSAPGNATVTFSTSGSDFNSRTINSLSYGTGETTSFTYLDNMICESATYGRFDANTIEDGTIAYIETEYRLISKVTYPNGDTTDYTYEKVYSSWGTDGCDTTFAISSRSDTVLGTVKNSYSYFIDGSYYTMLYLAGISEEEREAYWSGYDSYTNDVISGNKITHYTFNDENLCINESKTLKQTSGEILLSETLTEYNDCKLKSNITYKNYASGGSKCCTSYESFFYDGKGNIISHSDISGKYTSYTYDQIYSLVTKETSRQDSSTVVTKEYILTADNKSVATEKLLSNDVLISQFDYTYNSRGNISTQTEHLGTLNVVTSYTYGVDIPYLTGLSIQNTEYSEGYTYDIAGRKLTETDAAGNVTAYAYDTRGRLTSVTYPNGSTETYSYNIISNTTTVTSRSGLTLTYVYNGYGNLLMVKHGETVLESHTYDEYGRLASDIKYNGGKTVYAYDTLDRIISKTEYDAENAIVMRTNIAYSISSDNLFKTQTTVIGDSNAPSVITAEYADGRGFIIRRTRMNGTAEYADRYTYDNFGNVRSVVLSSGAVTRYTYDCMGNVTSTTDALGNVTSKTYDSRGNLLTATDARGNTATYTYDVLGRKISETMPFEGEDFGISYFEYDILGRLIEERHRNDSADDDEITYSRTVNTYDNMGNLISATAYDGENAALVSIYTYDASGNMLTMTSGGKTTSYTYDLFGRKIKITDALGAEETYIYRPDGALIEKHDRNGTTFSYTYDSLLRPVTDMAERTGKTTQTITYTYTATGAVRSKQNENVTLLYTYDACGRNVTETEISGSISTRNEYFYNSSDLRTDHKLYRNDVLVSWMGYSYDALGRMTSMYVKEQITTPIYPDYSGKWHVVPSSGSEYDMNFTLSDTPPEVSSIEITDTRTNTKKYYYVLPDWEWDELDSVYHRGTITHDGTNFSGTFGIYQELETESHVYDYSQITTYPASGLTSSDYSQRIYIFNDNNEIEYTVYVKWLSSQGASDELTTIYYVRPGGHDLGEGSFFEPTWNTEIISHEPIVRYTYDAVGNRTSEIKDDGSTVTYTYNAANLLKIMSTAVGDTLQQSDTYTYYLDGNLKTVTGMSGGVTSYTYDGLGRLKTENMLDMTDFRMVQYTYDAAGNRASVTRNGTTTTYTYDNNNRLISEVSSSQIKSYTYDANGNQLTAISNGNYAGAYTYDLWNMQATYTVDGTGITSYTYRPDGLRHSVQGKVHIWDNGNIIADIGSDTVYYIRALTLIYSQSGDTKTYCRFNGHGDVIALANANGAIIVRP